MSGFGRLILRLVLKAVARPRWTFAITLLLALASVGLAAWRLSISTDQNKLYSDKVPFFRDFLAFDDNFPENEAVYVVIDARGDERAIPVRRWTAAADAIAARLCADAQHVRHAVAKVPLEELGAQGLLFEDPANLRAKVEETREMLPLMKMVGEAATPITRGLGDSSLERLLTGLFASGIDARTQPFVETVASSLNQSVTRIAATTQPTLPDLAALDAGDPSRLGYFYMPDETDRSRHVMLVRVQMRQDFTSLTAISESVEGVRAAIKPVAKDFPEFRVVVTGRPALDADEMRTTDDDSHKAEAAALTAVFIGIMLLLRSWRLALAAEVALGVGIAWTFAWATLTLGELNLLSIVFLLALIGIGMDYLIQILSRYKVEAARRGSHRTIWVAVFKQVGPPINTACLGAAGAFLVSLFTDFSGAADLGLIAGGGLLLCLLSGYTFLPALLSLKRITRNAHPAPPKPSPSSIRHSPSSLFSPFLWLLLLLAGLPFALRTSFNPSLLELQADNLESVKAIRKIQTWSAVVLTKDLEALRQAREAIAGALTVGRTESVLSAFDNHEALAKAIPPLAPVAWLEPPAIAPASLAAIAGKARALSKKVGNGPASADLASFADTVGKEDAPVIAARLSAWQVGFVDELKEMHAAFHPGRPDLATLPAELRNHLIGRDGSYALYIYPKADLWNHAELDKFILDIEPRILSLSKKVTLTGIAHNIHHSTASIRNAFYRATSYALALIVLLVWLDLRKLTDTLLAISVLALGLPMLVALMGLFNVDWNFANFFGLPILIGAGHEYGVFLVHRYREARSDPRRAWLGWDVADKALLLCAFVTSSSFGFFFLLAHHKGLKSLGLVMALGSGCIYLATVAAVRPLLKRWLARLSHSQQPGGPLDGKISQQESPPTFH